MHASPAPSDAERQSPLAEVVRRHGATMANREGRAVAAHFGSATAEAAVCLSTVGIADRFDRTTLELRGGPQDLELALAGLAALGTRARWSRLSSRTAIVRCEHTDAAACRQALAPFEGSVDLGLSDRYAAIEVIGPSANELLAACDRDGQGTPPIVLRETDAAFEVLVPAAEGPAQWERLLEVGTPFRVACVGLDALDHLAASHRLERLTGQAPR